MRTAPVCFSIFQAPRSGIHSLINICCKSFDNLHRKSKIGYSIRLLSSSVCKLEGHSRKWSRRPINTQTERGNKNILRSTANIRHGISDEIVRATSAKLIRNSTDVSDLQKIQGTDIRKMIDKNKELASLITPIVFDIESTGHLHVGRIVEIAFQDLSGGKNSTFQTLVNPECHVPNSEIHHITTEMVNRPDVPRMKDLIPILLQYIKSRQRPGGYVMLAAHNARAFDVPILIKEFRRCNVEIPSDWLYLDTLPLGREAIKSAGSKGELKAKLTALREYYKIPSQGPDHRAMSDVYSLSQVFQRLTFDLELAMWEIVPRTFLASEVIQRQEEIKKEKAKKKKKSSSS